MAIKIAINHNTSYEYEKAVKLSPQIIRLRPAPHTRTEIEAYSLNISPKNHFINWQQDAFGNYLARINFKEPVKHFKVDVEVIANLKPINAFDFFVEDYAKEFPFSYTDELAKELIPYLEINEDDELLMNWVNEIKKLQGKSTIDFLVEVNQQLYNKLNYTIRLEEGVQDAETTLEKQLGSCRDFAWVLIQALRHLGLATRFVSGYLVQLKSDQKSLDGPSGPEEDFTDLHAWCEVFIPGAGWIGLDATSGLFASEGHIPLCCTPSPKSAPPIAGYVLEKAESKFHYSNNVTRIHEDPRVTKPFSDDELAAIHSLGNYTDEILNSQNAQLTMGGEPTFVSRYDFESEQWNTEADGVDKKKMAFSLANKLKEQFGKNALLHVGQGKWYPGEPLPRWEFNMFWRKDGTPLINNQKTYADISKKYNYNHTHSEKLINAIVDELHLPKNNIHPAYEDVFYYLWQENNLPININPLKVDLKDALERKALAKQLALGLNNPVGFLVPIEWNYTKNSWLSCAWKTRSEHLYLKPGNSPMGLRLPLDILPYMVDAQHPEQLPRSPFEEVDDLPDFNELASNDKISAKNIDENDAELLHPKKENYVVEEDEKEDDFYVIKKKKKEAAFEPEQRLYTIKTALVVEAREGFLHVFFPPIQRIEQYLELLAVVEKCASKLDYQIIIEGYKPPKDNRIESLTVSPDPGVVEVNIHPAKNWSEITNNYNILFDAALQSGLSTEKFMLDGRHSGSGGGHHITLGGRIPAESPFLRRPDVLKSMILFWQNHPGLSYLFSSTFVGTTSQAPRVDEGNIASLYNLQIALDSIKEGVEYPFWQVDRLLRNLLTDITGNTHRAEFCIDKMYSPDSSTGRLGILELRGFEMPPDKNMCLVQLLLVRSLFAKFWQKPYNQKLVKWGTQLHDKFMIHHFVKKDLLEVCEQLQQDGFNFNAKWLEPFFEFRFPLLGKIQHDEIKLEIRLGIEPWQVLGEEMGSNGVARFVDSSVERVELKVKGLNKERYVILCNGKRVPLTYTGIEGEFVSGIRYKAWSPPSAMHPLLPVDTPLIFDIFDLWNERSIGGCQYHVYHPGGRSYATYPVNAVEAESRKESRFFEFGHTQTTKQEVPFETFTKGDRLIDFRDVQQFNGRNIKPILDTQTNSDFPYTFDLRAT